MVGLALAGRARLANSKSAIPRPTSLQASDGKTYSCRISKASRRSWWRGSWAFTQGCTIECKSLAENGDKIRKFDVTYFMASVDALEDNMKFAKATQVKLGENMVDKKEADFLLLSDPTKATAAGLRRAQRAHREPLDVLYRQERKDCRHRQCRQAGDVSGRHDR